VAVGYLQDSSGELLFDNNGCVLKTDGTRNTIGTTSSDVSTGAIYCMQFTPNLDLSEIHSQGSYNIDKPNGIIQFSSNAQSKTIAIEYISDSLATECGSVGEPKVNKLAESALMDYIYYELIKNNVNTHANEKARARHEFYQSKKRAGRRINGIKMEDLLQTFKSYGKWN
jgi:V8-like Glu-specific endopeptidase